MDANIFKLGNPNLFPTQEGISASVKIQGEVLEYKSTSRKSVAPTAQRGEIKEFSPSSRLRMLKHFQKIDFLNHPEPLFVTLTYPDESAYRTLAQRNIDRQVMARQLERLTGLPIPAAWRTEWQIRKSGFWEGCICPHHHWLIFKNRYIPHVDINALWKKTIGHEGKVTTDIRRVNRSSAIQLYMAKYLSKEAVNCSLVIAAYHNRIGRAYGWLRKAEIPMNSLYDQRRLSDGQRDAFMRLADEQLPWVSAGLEQSFTLFGANAAEIGRKIISGNSLDGQAGADVQYPEQ